MLQVSQRWNLINFLNCSLLFVPRVSQGLLTSPSPLPLCCSVFTKFSLRFGSIDRADSLSLLVTLLITVWLSAWAQRVKLRSAAWKHESALNKAFFPLAPSPPIRSPADQERPGDCNALGDWKWPGGNGARIRTTFQKWHYARELTRKCDLFFQSFSKVLHRISNQVR